MSEGGTGGRRNRCKLREVRRKTKADNSHLMARGVDGTPPARGLVGCCHVVWLHFGLERGWEADILRGDHS